MQGQKKVLISPRGFRPTCNSKVPENEREPDALLTQLSGGLRISTLFSRFKISPMVLFR